MNLYFRLLLILARSWLVRRIGVLDESRLRFRVWPFDIDINFHLTNARYLALCDLCRVYYMSQLGLLSKLVKKKWLPVVQSQEVSYFKQINPFARFEVVTRLTYWDDKYWYTEHKFYSGDALCAVVQVRGLFLSGRKNIPTREILALSGMDVNIPVRPVPVEYWQNLLEAKKAPPKNRPDSE
jgi:acyl-CoA thioesterase FadM